MTILLWLALAILLGPWAAIALVRAEGGSVQPRTTSVGGPVAQATPADATGYAHPEWLAEPDWLEEHLDDPNLRVVALTPADEFAAGHIPGAVSVPPGELSDRLRGLPLGGEAVAYCRGAFCIYADQAIHALSPRPEVRVRRLEDGFPEWRRAGLPVAVGADDAEEAS
jgi:rhodanese-related sulfurtransferase